MRPGACLGTLAVVAAALLAGCHTYVPVQQPTPGSTVRLRVPVRSALDVPNGEPRTVAVDGLLISAGDSIVLESTERIAVGAYREIVQVDTLRMGRDQIASIELQQFDRRKTLGLTAAIAGGTAFLAATALGLVGGDSGDPAKGEQPPIVGQLDVTPLLGALLRLAGR